MAAHDYHEGQANYSPTQIWYDGCGECSYRSENLASGLRSLDSENWQRAWFRAIEFGKYGLPDMSNAEYSLLSTLWSLYCRVQEDGLPYALYGVTDERSV